MISLEKYPKTTELIKQFYFKRIKEGLEERGNVPQNIKDYYKSVNPSEFISNENLAIIMKHSPRMFFEAFDEKGIYILIFPVFGDKLPVKMSFSILTEKDGLSDNEIFENRLKAEQEALIKSFEMYEHG